MCDIFVFFFVLVIQCLRARRRYASLGDIAHNAIAVGTSHCFTCPAMQAVWNGILPHIDLLRAHAAIVAA